MDLETIKNSTSLLIYTPGGEELIAHKSFDGSFTAKSKVEPNNFINLSKDWIFEHQGTYYFKDPFKAEGSAERYLILYNI
tara:strand:- start:935 stop:1174 length:240 start_codon:yes stop_codon:yes gene_type:complete